MMTQKITKTGLQLLCMGAVLVGGLAFSATADASTCIDDQFSGVCLPLESAPAQAETATLAQADLSCDQFSGVCQTQETSVEAYPPIPSFTAEELSPSEGSPCDQFAGVCDETPSMKGDQRAQATGLSGL